MTDRDMPDQLADLMEMALVGGNVDEVNLVFEGLGYDFHAPTGWFLYLTKVSPELRIGAETWETGTLLVSAQVGAGPPTAYLGVDPRSGAAQYCDLEAIAQWIETSRDHDLMGGPVTTPAEHVEMALSAAKLGWSVTREIRRHGRSMGSLPPGLSIPTAVSYRFAAHNYAYNNETSEHHRDSGADLSLNLALGVDEQSASWNYALRNAEHVDPASITAAVAQLPPWHAPVAYFDEDLDEWVL